MYEVSSYVDIATAFLDHLFIISSTSMVALEAATLLIVSLGAIYEFLW